RSAEDVYSVKRAARRNGRDRQRLFELLVLRRIDESRRERRAARARRRHDRSTARSAVARITREGVTRVGFGSELDRLARGSPCGTVCPAGSATDTGGRDRPARRPRDRQYVSGGRPSPDEVPKRCDREDDDGGGGDRDGPTIAQPHRHGGGA